jgi:hypothetical protein
MTFFVPLKFIFMGVYLMTFFVTGTLGKPGFNKNTLIRALMAF